MRINISINIFNDILFKKYQAKIIDIDEYKKLRHFDLDDELSIEQLTENEVNIKKACFYVIDNQEVMTKYTRPFEDEFVQKLISKDDFALCVAGLDSNEQNVLEFYVTAPQPFELINELSAYVEK